MEHVPVLLEEAIASLDIKPDGIYVDCTLGRAGHSSEILKRIPSGHLYCFDKDLTAIEESTKRLEQIGKNFTILPTDFSHIAEELDKLGITKVDGILADLGVSSPQFDDPERGFSYRYDARLDMRMDRRQSLDAFMVVNTYPLERLAKILNDYGEEKEAYRIAKKIVDVRGSAPILTTFQLVEVIKSVKSPKELAKKGHPAKQTFQALRIEVNGETKALQSLLENGPKLLKQNGRLSIITFMSLDDRLVKQAYASLTKVEGSRHLIELPSQIATPDFVLGSRKPILPSEAEIEANPRASSAKLRTLIAL